MTILQDIINFILPSRCALCGRILSVDKGICDDCIKNIEFIKEPVCFVCGQPLFCEISEHDKNLLCANCLKKRRQTFRFSRSAFAYDNFSKKLILDFKFYERTDIASLLAKMMLVAGEDIFNAGVDVIVPVPLYYTRLIKRKYNQSALLAKELSKLTNIKADNFTLSKIRQTLPQVECTGHERINNVKGAFAVKNIQAIKNKRVLLVDDVLTTGSTLKECNLTLKKAGAKSVDNLTVARVI
jgi:ComF family protein